MPNYEKLTLDRFALNLKEGKYKNLTGARRAIGKTTSWTAKEKEKAQELAAKHFGDGAKPAKKAGPTKAKHAAPKKTAAKAGSKGVHGSKPAQKAAPQRSVTVEPTQKKTSIRPSSPSDFSVAATQSLQFARGAREEIESLKKLNPTLDFSTSEKQLHGIVTNAIASMSKSIESLPKPTGVAPRIEVPKTNNVQEEEPAETVAEVTDNGSVDDADLTPEEREAKALFLKGSGSTIAGLPRPV